MSDILDDLKVALTYKVDSENYFCKIEVPTLGRAYDEIERLREALLEISKIGPRFEAKGTSTTKMVTIARRALDGGGW